MMFNASEVYSIPQFSALSTLWRKGLDERTMHLTNYSVNKHAACEKLNVLNVEMF